MSENIAIATNTNEFGQAVEYKVIDWVDLPVAAQFITKMVTVAQSSSLWFPIMLELGQNADLVQSLLLAGVANQDDDWFESLDSEQVLEHLSGAAKYNYTQIESSLEPFRGLVTMELSDLEIMAKHKEVIANGTKYTVTPVPFKMMTEMLSLVDVVLYPLLALIRENEPDLTRLISASFLGADFMDKVQWLIQKTVRQEIDFAEWTLPDVLRLFAECVRINYRFFGKPFANMITAMLPKTEAEPVAEE